MKVAVAYHFFPLYRKAIIERLAADAVNDYVFIGDRIDPFHSGIEAMDMASLEQSGKFRFTKSLPWKQFIWQRSLVPQLLRSKAKVWIILGLPYNVSVWMAAVLGKLTGKRVIFWVHGHIKQESPKKEKLRNLFYNLSDGLLVYGTGAKAIAPERGFDKKPIYVVFNSLDVDEQERIRREFEGLDKRSVRSKYFNDPDQPTFICTSRLTKARGLEMAFEAAASLKKRGRPVNLLLVGDGSEKKTLEDLARELEVDVYFFGACYEEQILAELIMACDATVAPGKVGLTAMHSLIYGVPVITHSNRFNQMPEYEAVLDGQTGYFFAEGETESLAEAMLKIVTNVQRVDFRTNCIRVIEKYYNPEVQFQVISQAVRAEAPDDPVISV